jgi:TonB-linked SusC/RagA family outer membrane protein
MMIGPITGHVAPAKGRCNNFASVKNKTFKDMNKPKPVQQGLLFLMRVTLIQMLITSFSMVMAYAVPTMGQEVLERKITLDVEGTEFQQVLKLIGKQAKVKFAYSPELVEEGKKISIHVSDVRLADVLPDLLNPQVSYKVIGQQIVLVPRPSAEDNASSAAPEAPAFTVTGKVTDPTGQPLPGVNVLIKGTTNGTSTDGDGIYTLEMPDGLQTLILSFIGYATEEIPVNNRTVLDVVMAEDLATLNEVVVIGYGTQEKKEVTNAVVQLKGTEVLESKSAAVSNSLSGKVPGMIINQRNARPGADGAQILIRGASTFGDASALIVVDGVANRDGIDRIDPNDIESVTVLKDASAAIYGAQSANGVILITTKRGKSGKPTINYSYNQGFVSPVRLMKMSNASTYARGVNDLNDQAGTPRTYSDAQLAAFDNGQSPSTNWFSEVYRDYFTQSRQSLTVSGGNDVAKYFLSGGLLKQGSILTNDEISKYKQYNFRSNVDVQVTKRLSIGLDLAGRRQNTNSPYLELNTLYQNSVAAPPDVPTHIDGLVGGGRGKSNPLAVVGGPGYDRTQYDLLNGTVRFKYEIPHVEGLFIDGFGAIDHWTSFRKQFDYPWTYYGPDDKGVIGPLQGNSTRSLKQTQERNTSTTLNAKLNYQRTFNDIHSITAFIAAERNQTRYDYLQAQRSGFASSEIDELFAGDPSTQTATGNALETARLNYFGRLGYTLMDRYIVQLQFRSDGSYRFAQGNRWGFFPGVSLGWVLSEEDFMKNINALSYLKVRSSYGVLGNDRIDPFQYLNQYVVPSTSGTGYVIGGGNTNVINPTIVANPGVTWEKKKTFDIGLEGRLFQDKISFEIDYFSMRTSDILWQRSITVPTYTGLNSSNLPKENIGIVDNKGIDGQISYRKNINSDLSFNIGANMTYAKNTLVYWDEGTIYPEAYQKNEGKPIGAMLLYQATGIYRTQEDLDRNPGLNDAARLGDVIYKDVNGDGKVNSDDRVRSNYSNTPQIQYGFLFGAKYKNFDLSGNFMGQARAIVQFDYVFNYGSNAAEYYVQNAWSPQNPTGSQPRIGRSKAESGQGNTLNTRSVAFLRLKNIELGYNIPKDLLSKVGIERARIYVNGYNLLTFDKLKKDGLQDPEEINPQGWQFPQTKSVNMGVSVTF